MFAIIIFGVVTPLRSKVAGEGVNVYLAGRMGTSHHWQYIKCSLKQMWKCLLVTPLSGMIMQLFVLVYAVWFLAALNRSRLNQFFCRLIPFGLYIWYESVCFQQVWFYLFLVCTDWFEPVGRIRFVYVSFGLIDPICFDLPLLNWVWFDPVCFISRGLLWSC